MFEPIFDRYIVEERTAHAVVAAARDSVAIDRAYRGARSSGTFDLSRAWPRVCYYENCRIAESDIKTADQSCWKSRSVKPASLRILIKRPVGRSPGCMGTEVRYPVRDFAVKDAIPFDVSR
jgi:hypothetical protein